MQTTKPTIVQTDQPSTREKRYFEELKGLARRQVLSCLQLTSSLAELFHENTKLNSANVRQYVTAINKVLKQPVLSKLIHQPYKIYSLVEKTTPLPAVQSANSLERAITDRRSVRIYSGESLDQSSISRALYFSYGITGKLGPTAARRAVPSGGALYPLELYILSFRINGLEPGLYHYKVDGHALELLRSANFLDEAKTILLADGVDLDNAAGVIIITALAHRTLIKYQDRGYRMILLEAGQVAQNFSLMTTSLGLGCVWLGGFLDDDLCALLDVDPVSEPVLLAGVFGAPKAPQRK